MNINQLSWAPFSSRALSHGTLPSRFLKRPKSALLKSRAVSLLVILLPAPRILNSTISWSLKPRLPLTFTSLMSPSFLVSKRSSRPTLLFGSSNHMEKEVIISAIQDPPRLLTSYCCPFSRYHSDGSPPHGPGPVNMRLVLSVCRWTDSLIPGQVVSSRHPQACHLYLSSL